MANPHKTLTRRTVLQGLSLVGGALIVPVTALAPSSGAQAKVAAADFNANPFLKLTHDGRVIVVTGQCEMGQGAYTSLSQCVADELDVPWDSVEVEAAPVAQAYFNPMFGLQTTSASSSVPLFFQTMRKAGAMARDVLLRAAADDWGAQVADLIAENGHITHTDGRQAAYTEFLQTASRLEVDEHAPLKAAKDFRYIGKSMPRLDAKEKTIGAPIFGIDFDAPDRMVAVIARKPTENASLTAANRSAALAIAGVEQVVDIPAGVAVVATHFWAAKSGREALEAQWAIPENEALSSETLWARYQDMAGQPGYSVHRRGPQDATEQPKDSAKTLSADYMSPYQAHAPMEPLNCTVHLTDGRCDVWIGSQLQSVDRSAVAALTGLEEEAVNIHNLYLGGGFGRRAAPDGNIAAETAAIAVATKDIGKPIKVMWTREDDIEGGFYRPMALNRMEATLGADGKPTHWHHRVVVKSIVDGTPFAVMAQAGFDPLSVEGADKLPYAIENMAVDLHSPKDGPSVLWWRSIGHMHTALAVESFMDELAAAAGEDPFAYRLALLRKDAEQQRRLLMRLKELSSWTGSKNGAIGRGLVLHKFFTTPIAAVVDASIEDGRPKVHKITCVLDCGLAVNPQGVKMQVEGGFVYGLSAALNAEITLDNGVAEQSNFDSFEPLRMDQMPEVVVNIMDSEAPPSHVAEASTPLVGPGLSNALFAATGKRIRRLPTSRYNWG